MNFSNYFKIDLINFIVNKLKENIFNILFSIVVLILSTVLIKISKKTLTKYFEKNKNLKTKYFKLASKSLKLGIITLAAFLIMAKFNIPVNSFFTVISSIFVGSGLALQDFLSNIAKSIQFKALAPYSIGDLVEIDSKKGYIKKIDYTHTYIENKDQGVIMIPNSVIASKSVINYSNNK